MPIVLKQIFQQDPLTTLELTDWLIKDNADGSLTEKFTVQDLVDALENTTVGNAVQWYPTADYLKASTNYLPGDRRLFMLDAVPGVKPTRMYKFVPTSMGVDDGSESILKPDDIDPLDPGRFEQQL